MSEPAMARAPLPLSDPSQDAAALLRRLGFLVLMVGLPSAALVARRGAVMVMPVGVSLLVLAALLDGHARPLRDNLQRLARSAGVVGVVIGLVWMGISLLWAPLAGGAAERFLSTVATVAIALAGYLALPDRMRSANLYLVPVGAALAATAAIVLSLVSGGGGVDLDQDGQSLERGVVIIALFVWPSVAWLRSRERDLEALTLAILVATAAVVVGPQSPTPVALAVGALAYALTSLWPQAGATIAGGTMAVLVGIAPLLPAVVAYGAGRHTGLGPWLDGIHAWGAIVMGDPLRLVTGRGFGAFLASRFTGSLPVGTPNTTLVQVWYDLGLVGALAAMASLWAGPRAAVASYAPLLPGIMGAFATAFTLAVLGIGTGQMWLLTAVTLLALSFVAAERGQFRTTRPRAILFGAARSSG